MSWALRIRRQMPTHNKTTLQLLKTCMILIKAMNPKTQFSRRTQCLRMKTDLNQFKATLWKKDAITCWRWLITTNRINKANLIKFNNLEIQMLGHLLSFNSMPLKSWAPSSRSMKEKGRNLQTFFTKITVVRATAQLFRSTKTLLSSRNSDLGITHHTNQF